jgi:predicted acylesterase/phospholipase RssA
MGVFQGGGCRAAAFSGAILEAAERGVNFSGLAGASAGSIVAALLAAGATAPQVASCLSSLDFTEFISTPDKVTNYSGWWCKWIAKGSSIFIHGAGDMYCKFGRYSSRYIENWINSELNKILNKPNLDKVHFEDLPKPLWIVATDLTARKVKVWSQESTPKDEVAFAVRCSCTIPGFFQPVNNRYLDGGLLSNLPTFVFSLGGRGVYAKRILAFRLSSSVAHQDIESTEELGLALIDTVIDGATALQADILNNTHEINIDTGSVHATDFESMTPEKIDQLTCAGREATRIFLNNELAEVHSGDDDRTQCEGDDEVFAILTRVLLSRNIRKLIIAAPNAKWIYSIYPTILSWRRSGVEIHAYLERNDEQGHEAYRRRLVIALGIHAHVVDSLPFRGYLIDPESDEGAQAVVYDEQAVGGRVLAVQYRAREDNAAIRALANSLPNCTERNEDVTLTLRPEDPQKVIALLKRHVNQYSRATLTAEVIPVEDLTALSKLVRGYKYQQIRALADMFRDSRLRMFECASVDYGDKKTIVTPPVVEATGDKLILVQGTTRSLYLLRARVDTVACILVRDLTSAMPSALRVKLKDVLVAGRAISTEDRYAQNIDREFRPIEYATHHPEETLI